jgi:arylsulfatase A-like enzyme
MTDMGLRLTPLRVLALATAVGGATGLVEMMLVSQAIRVGVAVRMGPDFVWMVPAANLLLFGAIGALTALGLALRPAWRTRSAWIVGLCVGVAALELLLLVEVVHDLAAAMLAAGIGVQATRGAGGRWIRRGVSSAPTVAIATILWTAGLTTWTVTRRATVEADRVAALPAARADAPNVLLLILDTVRAAATSASGAPDDPTPHLDRAGARGVVFDVAIAPSPWTLPSHASMFTGRWPGELSAGWEAPLDGATPTLAEVFADRGWATAGFVGNLLNTARHTGLARGFLHYADYDRSPGEWVVATSIGRSLTYSTSVRRILARNELVNRRFAGQVVGQFLEWLDGGPAAEQERPWFAFVNLYDAHEPHLPPNVSRRDWNRFVHRGGMVVGGNAWVEEKWTMDARQRERHRLAYDARVRAVDEEVGRLLDALEERGVLEHTIVVITSDHGEQLGERGLFEHNNSLYLPALHVPLVVLAPGGGVPAGARVRPAVSLRDVPATILDLAGVDPALPGASLRPLWTDGPDVSEPSPAIAYLRQGFVEQPGTPVSRGVDMRAIVRDRWLYVHNGDDTDEIYDLSRDPFEGENRAGRDLVADSALRSLRATLYRMVTGREVPDDLPIRPARVGGGPPT